MGSALARLKKASQPPKGDEDDKKRKDDGHVHPALKKLRQESEARGVTLQTDGEGGMPAEVVLEVMRRDGYRCKRCGGTKDLSIHHKGRHLENVRLALTQIPKNDPDGVATICGTCHDTIHDRDRAGRGGPGDDPSAK